MDEADRLAIQHLNNTKAWIDLNTSVAGTQAQHFDPNLPDLGPLSITVLLLAISYCYKRLRPVQDDINALWDRVGGAKAGSPRCVPFINGVLVPPPEVPMQDDVLLALMNEAGLRTRLTQLATAKRAREITRANLVRELEEKLAESRVPVRGVGGHGLGSGYGMGDGGQSGGMHGMVGGWGGQAGGGI